MPSVKTESAPFRKFIDQIDVPLMTNGTVFELSYLRHQLNDLMHEDGGIAGGLDNRAVKSMLSAHCGDRLTIERQHGAAASASQIVHCTHIRQTRTLTPSPLPHPGQEDAAEKMT